MTVAPLPNTGTIPITALHFCMIPIVIGNKFYLLIGCAEDVDCCCYISLLPVDWLFSMRTSLTVCFFKIKVQSILYCALDFY